MEKNSATLTLHQEIKSNGLAVVLQLLRRHGYSGTSYYELGLYLGLISATLDNIKENNKGDVSGCLRECLKAWLQKADSVQDKGRPTIYSLVSALRELGENGVADGIEDEIQKKLGPAGLILDRNISDDSLSKLLPQLAAIILHSQGIIKKIKLRPDDPLHSLNVALQEGVASDDRNLLKLAKVLKANGAADIAAKIEAEYFTKFTETTSQRQPILPPLIFEDEIYGDIVIDHPLILKIIKTSQFQRLKDIKQLGYTYQNIPKANYSRLQHSIGMYYLAGEYVKQLQRRQPELDITESDVLCVQIAALCFNLGHGPFSHTFRMFLKEICSTDKAKKPWENVSETSVMMFDYMLKSNEGLMDSFEEYLETKDIEFVKELMKEKNEKQFNEKEFLYEIILNKSQLNVKVIDYTTRDAAVLGAKINFKWRVFLTRVRVLRCQEDGKLHICFHEDDLDAYTDFFITHSSIFRDLYYNRKIRIVAVMIQIILTKANEAKLIPDTDGLVTISDAAKSMAAYTHLTDSILTLIRPSVEDPLVKVLLNCLDTLKLIAQIGYIIPPDEWNTGDLKEAIVQEKNIDEKIARHLIIDRVLNGYDRPNSWTQHYYRDDGTTDIWRDKWAQQKQITKPPWRVFLVSGNDEIIGIVKDGLKKVIDKESLDGKLYDPDHDLMPDYSATGGIYNC